MADNLLIIIDGIMPLFQLIIMVKVFVKVFVKVLQYLKNSQSYSFQTFNTHLLSKGGPILL